MSWEVLTGDCLEVMPTLEANSVDTIITDPPYGLSFMGKDWDHGVPGEHFWREALRVAKPGAMMLAFGGTRTFHRLTVAIEDAGWEIRDVIMWVYASGFPKSHDISKAIDREAGAEREITGRRVYADGHIQNSTQLAPPIGTFVRAQDDRLLTAPATEAARTWNGYGTALKPAWEPIIVARKPLDGTVAQNVLKWGTGGLNIRDCRVGTEPIVSFGGLGRNRNLNDDNWKGIGKQLDPTVSIGRWPANLIHDGSDEVVGLFPVTAGKGHTPRKRGSGGISTTGHEGQDQVVERWHDSGSAARFFYCAKASKHDRDEGLSDWPLKSVHRYGAGVGEGRDPDAPSMDRNHHPTVKPTDLLRYLCRLVTPPGGIVLDPFAGSGSTGKAAMLEGFRFIGIEREDEYAEIARARIAHAAGQTRQLEML